MPSTRTVLALAALLVVAGCTGLPDPGSSSPTTGEPDGTGSPATTTPPADVIDYADLPNETRRSVRMAVENGSVLRDASAFDGLSPEEDEYVRYDGTTYALEWDRMHMRGEYGLEAVQQVNASRVDSNASVVTYTNLTETGQRLFDRARNGSELQMYGSGAFPDAFFEYRYVEYRGRYYRPRIVHADIPQWELSVREVDAGVTDDPDA